MDKITADRLIEQYQKKIYGFALKNLSSISQAEELAADICCEVYLSFLGAESIANTDGYVYRIARNVYSKYISGLKHHCHSDISQAAIPFEDSTQERLEKDETVKRLKTEIALLSDRQRTIIYLHYYLKQPVAEIAKRLNISQGTVKWHLSDARSTLKESIDMDNTRYENTQLSVNPIKFVTMGHGGTPGSKGDTNDMFDTRLKQNIAFACYWESRTVAEIARAVGVPAVYVADEIRILEEYGYIDRMDNTANPRYLTNMYITDLRRADGTDSGIYEEAAAFLCENVYEKLLADFDSSDGCWGFSCDGNDKNFMKYNIIMLCQNCLLGDISPEPYNWEDICVKRPDGGSFIAFASAVDDCTPCGGPDPNWTCGYMTREGAGNVFSIQLDCRFSSREGGWENNTDSDWDILYRFIKNGRDSLSVEEYKRLCDKGYIHDDIVQVMTYAVPRDDKSPSESYWQIMTELIAGKMQLSDKVKKYSAEFDRRLLEASEQNYPPHMRKVTESLNTNILSRGGLIPRIIEKLLEKGVLSPLTDVQKKAVLSVLVY